MLALPGELVELLDEGQALPDWLRAESPLDSGHELQPHFQTP